MTGSNARSRRKSKLEPISLAELAETPGMSGFCSFLTRPADQPVPALDGSAEGDTPPVGNAPGVEETAAALTGSTPGTISVTPPVLETAAAPAPPQVEIVAPVERTRAADTVRDTVIALETPPVVKTVPIRTSSAQIARRFQPLENARVRRAVLAQDGHTMAEQIIYSALFHSGEGEGAYRDVSVGNRWIMASTGLSERTVQLNLKSLQLKLSIEILRRHNPDTNEPTQYRVYSFESILERRRLAGLDMVARKRGGGVRLVRSEAAGGLPTPPVFKA